MLIRLTIVFSLALACTHAGAGKPNAVRLEWAVMQSEHVVLGRIKSATLNTEYESDCGDLEIWYSARVIEVFKGEMNQTQFCSDSQLATGAEYLIFFNGDRENGKSQPPILMLPIVSSFLDPGVKWAEINSVSGVNPGPIEVRIEKIRECALANNSGDCRILHARELIRLDDVLALLRVN